MEIFLSLNTPSAGLYGNQKMVSKAEQTLYIINKVCNTQTRPKVNWFTLRVKSEVESGKYNYNKSDQTPLTKLEILPLWSLPLSRSVSLFYFVILAFFNPLKHQIRTITHKNKNNKVTQ